MAINETINNITGQIAQHSTKLSWEQVTAVSQSTIGIIGAVLIFVLEGLLLYIIIAGSIRARLSDGTKLKKSMLSNRNTWLVYLGCWLLQVATYLIIFVFPIWTRF
jgi:hypothetical protein